MDGYFIAVFVYQYLFVFLQSEAFPSSVGTLPFTVLITQYITEGWEVLSCGYDTLFLCAQE